MVASVGLEDRRTGSIDKAWRIACSQIGTQDLGAFKKQALELLQAWSMLPSELQGAISSIIRIRH